jgi:AcrR family transcriptional regulator
MRLKKNGKKEKWLNEGYRQFAEFGPDQLSINQISKELSTSRASFYHHFGDIDIFIDELLEFHWDVSEEFHLVGKTQCKNLMPDLYALLSKYPVPLRFNWQLFHHRHIPRYNYLFINTYEAGARAFTLDLFAQHVKLDLPTSDLYNLYKTLGEAWYSRLNPHNLSTGELQKHAEAIIQDLTNFMKSSLYSSLNRK